MAAKKKPKSRSGPNIPEAQRSTVSRKLRLSRETAARLDEMRADSGYTLSEFATGMVDAQYDEWQSAQARQRAKK